jgi:hypothetical protein
MSLGNNVRPQYTGTSEAQKWLHGIYDSENIRRSHGARFHDVLHQDFLEDPMRVVREIYRRFDLHLDPRVEEEMRAWLARQKPEQKTGHRYCAADFGLDEGVLRAMYADYIRKYGIPTD